MWLALCSQNIRSDCYTNGYIILIPKKPASDESSE